MAVTVLRTDGWMPQTAALDPALLMYIRYVLSECTDRSMCDAICSHSRLQKVAKRPVTELDGQDASRPLSVDGEAVPRTSSHTRKATTPLCP